MGRRDDDEEPTIPCPYCRREIHEDSQRCPGCGNYLSEEDAPPGRKPWWLVLGVVFAFGILRNLHFTSLHRLGP